MRLFLRVIEDHFDFNLFDLEPEFSFLEGFPELPFHDGENGFNFVSLMVLIGIKHNIAILLR